MTVAFAIVVAILFALFIWDLSASQTENRVRAERHATRYAATAEQRISQSCAVATDMTLAECIRQVIETTHEQQRAESDLAAQRDMAKWAWAVVVVSIASVAVGLIGIYFIKRTFDKTVDAVDAARDANEIARRSAERQLRAYMSIGSIGIEGFTGTNFDPVVFVSNKGTTPARWFRAWTQVFYLAQPDTDPIHFAPIVRRSTSEIAPDGSHRLKIRRQSVSEASRTLILNKGIFIVIAGFYEFRDVFGRKRGGVFKFFVDVDTLTDTGHADVISATRNNFST